MQRTIRKHGVNKMNIESDFQEIMEYAHFWNRLPDWQIAKKIYTEFPDSYSVLTPFAYAYLEEVIRSITSEYGREIIDESGKGKWRSVGSKLINLAIKENSNNQELISILEEVKGYFQPSQPTDCGNNRSSVVHGYMHSSVWNKDSFEKLIHDIAKISKFAGF